MILDLLADGKRVGVTANSHKVISNLLAAPARLEMPVRGASPLLTAVTDTGLSGLAGGSRKVA